MSWWRTICSWFRREKPVVEVKVEVCDKDHVADHMCWDDFFAKPLPGDLCWFCTKCARSWHTPNPHKFPSDYQVPRAWAEYQSPERQLLIYDAPPPEIRKVINLGSKQARKTSKALDKKRKKKDAATKSSRNSTSRKRKSVSNAAGRTRS